MQLVAADLGEPDTGLIGGGATDFFLDLAASGATPHALAASLSGECAMAHFHSKGRVMASSDQIIVKTGKMIIRGGGKIGL